MMKFKVYVTPQLRSVSISELNVANRIENALKRSHIFTVGELFAKYKTMDELGKIKNMGEKSVDELIIAVLDKMCSFMTDEEKTEYAKTLATMNS